MLPDCTLDCSITSDDLVATEAFEESNDTPELGRIETTSVGVEHRVDDRFYTVSEHVYQVDGDRRSFMSQTAIDAYRPGERT